MLFQRFLVVHQWHAVESDRNFRCGKTRLDLAERFKVLQFQIFGNVQYENVIGEGGHCHFHFCFGDFSCFTLKIWNLTRITTTQWHINLTYNAHQLSKNFNDRRHIKTTWCLISLCLKKRIVTLLLCGTFFIKSTWNNLVFGKRSNFVRFRCCKYCFWKIAQVLLKFLCTRKGHWTNNLNP